MEEVLEIINERGDRWKDNCVKYGYGSRLKKGDRAESD